MVSLGIYEEDDWLKFFGGSRERYDSINTLVMRRVIASVPITIGDHTVDAYFRYPVHSSKYYK